MKTTIAFLLIVYFGQYGAFAGMILATPLSFSLLFLPNNLRCCIVGFTGGLFAPVASLLLSVVMFQVFKTTPHEALPVTAAFLSLISPWWNDFDLWRKLRKVRSFMTDYPGGYFALTSIDFPNNIEQYVDIQLRTKEAVVIQREVNRWLDMCTLNTASLLLDSSHRNGSIEIISKPDVLVRKYSLIGCVVGLMSLVVFGISLSEAIARLF